MRPKSLHSIPFYEFEIFQRHSGVLRHAVFTRRTNAGNPKTPQMLQRIFNSGAGPLFFKNQLHGTNIVTFNPLKNSGTAENEGDAWITSATNAPLAIRIADCASILLFDPVKKVIANIHAGWRGLAKKIIRKVIQKMRCDFGSESPNLLAGISPMIGPCCCMFSGPHEELPRHMHKYITEDLTVNLWAAAEGHLRECGLPKTHIENARVCTFCNPEDFYSYRREGDTGRFFTVIMLA